MAMLIPLTDAKACHREERILVFRISGSRTIKSRWRILNSFADNYFLQNKQEKSAWNVQQNGKAYGHHEYAKDHPAAASGKWTTGRFASINTLRTALGSLISTNDTSG